jgi:hypothetical protein
VIRERSTRRMVLPDTQARSSATQTAGLVS